MAHTAARYRCENNSQRRGQDKSSDSDATCEYVTVEPDIEEFNFVKVCHNPRSLFSH